MLRNRGSFDLASDKRTTVRGSPSARKAGKVYERLLRKSAKTNPLRMLPGQVKMTKRSQIALENPVSFEMELG
jgi:hypothetical protein